MQLLEIKLEEEGWIYSWQPLWCLHYSTRDVWESHAAEPKTNLVCWWTNTYHAISGNHGDDMEEGIFFIKSSKYNQSFEVFVPCVSPHVCPQLKLKQLTQYPLYLWKKKRKWTDISIFASPDILFNFCFANLAADIKSTPAVAKIILLQQKYTTTKIWTNPFNFSIIKN